LTNTKTFLNRYFRWSCYSFLVGILAGIAAAIFLITLDLSTHFREGHEAIIWALPLAGLFIGWMYHKYGKEVEAGNNLILDEIHDPKKLISIKMAPFILIGTILTHLFGG